MKKTLILGASSNSSRYSYLAAARLKANGHEIVQVGKKDEENPFGPIVSEQLRLEAIDTVTLYLNPQHQKAYYDYLLDLQPKRIIFNPGAENEELQAMAEAHGIKCENACTLVLLGTGLY